MINSSSTLFAPLPQETEVHFQHFQHHHRAKNDKFPSE